MKAIFRKEHLVKENEYEDDVCWTTGNWGWDTITFNLETQDFLLNGTPQTVTDIFVLDESVEVTIAENY